MKSAVISFRTIMSNRHPPIEEGGGGGWWRSLGSILSVACHRLCINFFVSHFSGIVTHKSAGCLALGLPMTRGRWGRFGVVAGRQPVGSGEMLRKKGMFGCFVARLAWGAALRRSRPGWGSVPPWEVPGVVGDLAGILCF